ncbi:hypothetical protein ACHAWF_009152 [Thalassiosira exigua]
MPDVDPPPDPDPDGDDSDMDRGDDDYDELELSAGAAQQPRPPGAYAYGGGEALLPRKRSQATKSPVEAVESGGGGGGAGGGGVRGAVGASAASAASESPAMMATTTTTTIRANAARGRAEDDDERDPSRRSPPSDACGGLAATVRTSLNASFEAAAAAAFADPSKAGAGKGAATATPKRRKQSFDAAEAGSAGVAAAAAGAIRSGAHKPPPTPQPQARQGGQPQPQQHHQQQHLQQPASPRPSSFTPLRPPRTALRRRRRGERTDSTVLFSPKPVRGGDLAAGAVAGGGGPRPGAMLPGLHLGHTRFGPGSGPAARSLRPPRPLPGRSAAAEEAAARRGGALGEEAPSSPLTPSPERSARRHEASSASTRSPATPFRFHSFPASLPRVHPRPADDDDEGAREAEETSMGGASAPTTGSARRLGLRPRASAAEPPAPPGRDLPSSAAPAEGGGGTTPSLPPPPPSPATRRLFVARNYSDDSAEDRRGGDPASAGQSSSQNDLSGDWSEATSLRSLTNERIRMTRVPSHVDATAPFRQHELNDLEEDEEVDTVVMEEEEEDSHRGEMAEGHGGGGPGPGLGLGLGSATVVKTKMHSLDHASADDDDDDDVDDEFRGSIRTSLSGTRLNFGSPPPEEGGPRPPSDDERPSSAVAAAPPTERKKGRRRVPPGDDRSSLESTLHPHTPRGSLGDDFRMHNLEMSPIARLPDDDDDDDHDEEGGDHEMGEDHRSRPLFRGVASSVHPGGPSPPDREGLAAPASATAAVDASADSTSTSFSKAASACSRGEASASQASTAGANNTTIGSHPSHSSSRPVGGVRKFRPKPDTSAFDVGTPSLGSRSPGSKDSERGMGGGSHPRGGGVGGTGGGTGGGGGGGGTAGDTSRGGGGGGGGAGLSHLSDPSAHRLLCPPTPIRTPAWAHADAVGHHGTAKGGLQRANSLIATKVLAACPPRVLDNLSSLEDSMLENDLSGSTMDTAETTGGSYDRRSFAPVEEEEEAAAGADGGGGDEGDDDEAEEGGRMFRSLEDHRSGESGSEDAMSPPPRRRTGTAPGDGDDVAKSLPPERAARREDEDDDDDDAVVTISDFDNLGVLGSGAFADVYKVRSKKDRKLYAVKRTRRQFRGVKDRERAMAEVHTMRRLQSALLSEAADAHQKSGGGSGGGGARGGGSGGAQSSSSAAAGGSGAHHHHHNQHHQHHGLYLLFFVRAWQQDGFFHCQTELCSRATCRHLRLSLTTDWERDAARYPSLEMCAIGGADDADGPPGASTPGKGDGGGGGTKDEAAAAARPPVPDRLLPERTILQIAHDTSRGLRHIHSHFMVHYDIKPSNIFLVRNPRHGTICKIGDFGLAGDAGERDTDGQEGDTAYMPGELLAGYGTPRHPSVDVFSLGLALYELAAGPRWSLPREGERWHEVRNGDHVPDIPAGPGVPCGRSPALIELIRSMIRPSAKDRPTAVEVSESEDVRHANASSDSFVSRYVGDVERHDARREREMECAVDEARRRSSTPVASMFQHHVGCDDTGTTRVPSAATARDLRTPTNHHGDEEPSPFFR